MVQRLARPGRLGVRARRSVAFTGGAQVASVLLTLGSQAVLARLLTPADYGLVAVVLVFSSLALLGSELGLLAALVQTRRLTDRLLSSAVWLSAAVGLAMTGVLVAVAPLVAQVYGEPRVVPLLQLSALGCLLTLTSVPLALLQRSLRFGLLVSLELTAVAVGLVTTVVLAARGFGAVSLVVGPLVQAVVLCALAYAAVGWVPRHLPHRAELGELWRFGRGLVGANALYFVARNADTVLLGRVVSAADLGLYSRSYTTMVLPLRQVSQVLGRVLLPTLAQLQDDVPRLRRAWVEVMRATLAVGLPVGLGIAASAEAFVGTLFGDDWLGMVPVLVLLAASLPPQLVSRNLGALYQATGRTGLQFRLALVSTATTLVAIVAGLPWGITGVATALLVHSAVGLLVGLVPMMRIIGLSAATLWVAARGYLTAGAVLVGAALAVLPLVDGAPAPVVLLVQAAAGGTAYVGVLLLLERDQVLAVARRVLP